jgi:hypothetical protein
VVRNKYQLVPHTRWPGATEPIISRLGFQASLSWLGSSNIQTKRFAITLEKRFVATIIPTRSAWLNEGKLTGLVIIQISTTTINHHALERPHNKLISYLTTLSIHLSILLPNWDEHFGYRSLRTESQREIESRNWVMDLSHQAAVPTPLCPVQLPLFLGLRTVRIALSKLFSSRCDNQINLPSSCVHAPTPTAHELSPLKHVYVYVLLLELGVSTVCCLHTLVSIWVLVGTLVL